MTSPHPNLIILAGPCGTGKSTVGAALSTVLSLPYLDGDDYHPPANIAKMGAGIPLTTADRLVWFDALWRGIQTHDHKAIVACSALTVELREILREMADDDGVPMTIVFLAADQEELLKRMRSRQGHYMKENMVESQVKIMEVPREGMEKGTYVVQTKGLGIDDVVQETIRVVMNA